MVEFLSRLSRGVGHLTLVLLVGRNLFRGMLNLEEQLDSFNRGDSRLGNGSRNTTGNEVLCEGKRIGSFPRHDGFSSGFSREAEQRVCERDESPHERDESWLSDCTPGLYSVHVIATVPDCSTKFLIYKKL